MSAQNKKLTILSILFVLCVLGLGYWYFFVYKCGVLPSEYEFLERFVVKSECKQREYKVKGIMYNIREGEDSNNIVFDFNAWDTESRESLYYENIEVGKDKILGEFEVIPDNFGAVEIGMKFEKEIFTLKDYNLESLIVEELKLTEEKYNEVFNTVYTAITRSPMVEDNEYQIIPSEELNAVFTGVRHRDLFKDISFIEDPPFYFPEIYDNFTNKSLYRPWILSYLYIRQDELGLGFDIINREDILDMLVFDYDKYIEENIGEPQCDIEPVNEGKPIDKGKYQESNSFACLMVYQIFENLDLNDETILNKYCDLEYFENSINSLVQETEFSQEYSFDEYISLLNSEILAENYEGKDSIIHSSNIASILADMYGVKKLYGMDINNNLNNRVNFVLDYILLYGVPFLKNICSVSYFSNLAIQDEDLANEEELKVVSEKTEDLLIMVNKRMLELMEDDIYAISLCLEGYGDYVGDETDKILKTQIQKIINLYFYKSSQILGVWEDKEYDIRINARFLRLLAMKKGVLLR